MGQEKSQNKIFIAGFVLILIVIVWALLRPAILKLAQKSEDSEEKMNEEILKAPVVSAKGLFERTKNKEKFLIFDLRGADEFGKEHLTGSENILPEDLNAGKIKSLGIPKTSSIIILNGGEDTLETARKTNELVSAGFANAKYLQGGISDWKSEGYPLVSGGNSPLDEGKIKKISLDELADLLSADTEAVQFVDVRDAADFNAGHIFGAENVPAPEIEKKSASISLIKRVVLYGNSEEQAKRAAATLFDLNFFNIFVFSGGLEEWKNAGGKME